MAEAALLPLQPDLVEQDAPSADYLPLAHRIMAVAFFAFFTAMLGVLWYVAARRRRRPIAGYAWSTFVFALVTVFVAVLAFWRPRT